MAGEGRDMTLREYIERLPEGHRARLELISLRAELVALRDVSNAAANNLERAAKAERERDEARRAAEWWRNRARGGNVPELLPGEYVFPWERDGGDDGRG